MSVGPPLGAQRLLPPSVMFPKEGMGEPGQGFATPLHLAVEQNQEVGEHVEHPCKGMAEGLLWESPRLDELWFSQPHLFQGLSMLWMALPRPWSHRTGRQCLSESVVNPI